jgi:hypothetical protein
MMSLDVATVLLQWSAGGLFFLWFSTRRPAADHGGDRIGIGYGWLLRAVFGTLAVLAVVLGARYAPLAAREVSAAAVAAVAAVAGVRSFRRRAANPAWWDLAGAIAALPGLVAVGLDTDATAVSLVRLMIGALFLGAVTDAMLLGHWYLVQPGLPRRHLNEMVTTVGVLWPVEVVSMLLPTGMLSVWSGDVDDGWNGMLGWMWGACAVATLGLVFVTRAALRERYYSAVMAATGLLYLAILTGFGTDLVARAVLDR